MTSIPELDRAVQIAEDWIGEFAQRLGWHDRERACRALVVGLHALRDCLPANEAVYVSAHLPPLLRGFYFEGWRPTRRPASLKTRSALLERIHDGVHRDPAIDPEQVARAVLALLAVHLPESELENARAVTPAPLRNLWPS